LWGGVGVKGNTTCGQLDLDEQWGAAGNRQEFGVESPYN